MRTKLLAIFSLLAASTMTSCVKEYTCQCKISYSGEPGLPAEHFREYKLANTYKKAKNECESYSRSYVEGNITTTEQCELY